jgi:hypothetical protein
MVTRLREIRACGGSTGVSLVAVGGIIVGIGEV